MLFLVSLPFAAVTVLFWFMHLLASTGLTSIFNLSLSITCLLWLVSFLSLVIDLGLIARLSRGPTKRLRIEPISPLKISVGMTAYNDEGVIGQAVKDFIKAPNVVSVIVIDNNCTDKTAEEAKQAGAKVVKEPVQGFGAACQRALKEARKEGNLVVLVEGDQTFSSTDLKKLTAYIENVDMVVGTRTTAEIVAPDSQVNWFMRYGNLFIAKLLQLRYWGQVRLTDVGCTFRAIRPEALDKIIGLLKVKGNEFNPHMNLVALKQGLKVIETPVTLKKRAGISKGVGSDYWKGLKTGFKMWWEILLH
jgi:glycosyltransferase involved in cell wall biosynthesis